MASDEFFDQLRSKHLDVRLRAARELALRARSEDADNLREALAREKVVWVRTALQMALARASIGSRKSDLQNEDTEDIVSADVSDQIKTIAASETTKLIVHEVAPILGALRMYAGDEISDFEHSRTKKQIERLQELLHALDRLSHAAVAPTIEEIDLPALIAESAHAEGARRRVSVELAGPTPLLVLGDPTLLRIAVANGIRNALEAVEQLDPEGNGPPVVVNWGETDRDTWIVVLDRGSGPPLAIERAFEMGNTTKRNHLGMGLATARQALKSLSGTTSLSERGDTGGACFEIRWPRPRIADQ